MKNDMEPNLPEKPVYAVASPKNRYVCVPIAFLISSAGNAGFVVLGFYCCRSFIPKLTSNNLQVK